MKEPQITKNKSILHGAPVIAGTRIPVAAVLGQLSVGNGNRKYLKKVYPQLKQEEIDAALEYASKHLK